MNEPQHQRTAKFDNNLSEISRIHDFVHDFCDAIAGDKDLRAELCVVLEELLTNVISYGVQAPGKCQTYAVLEAVGDHIILKLRDNGQPFNPTALPDPDLKVSFEDRTVGGLGILLVRHLTDHMHYERRGDENHLTLRKSRMRPN